MARKFRGAPTYCTSWRPLDQNTDRQVAGLNPTIAIPDHEPCITAGLYIYRIRRRERCAEAGTAAANAAVAPEADASKATDNLEFRKAAVNAADATEAATLKKPTGKLTDDTSEK